MTDSLRRVEDTIFVAAAALDKISDYHENKERHLKEKDAKYGVSSLEYISELENSSVEDTEKHALDRAMYWDELRNLRPLDALIIVLRYCMGYSCTEIAAGLGLTYAQVKYRCKLRRH